MTIEEMDERLTTNSGRIIADTGDDKFQFSLSWDELVDLDIHMSTPKGICFYRNRKLAGAELDVDRMPSHSSDSLDKGWAVAPVENIVCDKAFPGVYAVKVVYFSGYMYPTPPPAAFTVRCRVGTVDNIVRHTLATTTNEVVICSFSVDNDGRISNYVEFPTDFVWPAQPPFGFSFGSSTHAAIPAPKRAARKAPTPAAKKAPAPAKKKAAAKPAAKKAATKKPTSKKPVAKPTAKATAAKKAADAKKKAAAKKAADAKKKAAAKKAADAKKKAAAKKAAAKPAKKGVKPAAKKAAAKKKTSKK